MIKLKSSIKFNNNDFPTERNNVNARSLDQMTKNWPSKFHETAPNNFGSQELRKAMLKIIKLHLISTKKHYIDQILADK